MLRVLDDVKLGELGKYMLLPGDPDRVGIMAKQWDTAEERTFMRGFRLAQGTYQGVPIAAFSSMIGAPSLETVLQQLAERGVDTFIRVGTSGSLQPEIKSGDMVINDASVRMDGTTRLYVMDEYPAAASYEVTLALIEAGERLGECYHVGIGATTASFYAGQGRVGFGGYKRSSMDSLIPDLQRARVLNFEMEAAALFTLCRLYGLRAGSVVTTLTERVTGKHEPGNAVERACRMGAEAVKILTGWDQRKQKAGKPYFYPGLLG